MMDTPQVLLGHYLKQLRLPALVREYPKLAEQCAKEGATFEAFLLWLDDEERLLRAGFRGRVRSDGDHPAARLEDAPGTLQSFAADGVKHDIKVPKALFETRGAVIGHLFSTQLRYELDIARGRGRDYTRSVKPGKLHRKDADRARSACTRTRSLA